jgi:replication factor A1
MAKVKDLHAKQGNVTIELDVLDVGPSREFQKFGKPGKVASAIAKDDTGDVKLTLWNDEIEQVKAGDRIKLTNGYVSEWQGELQVSTGRFGKIEVVGKHDEAMEKPSEQKSTSSKHALSHAQHPQKKSDEEFANELIDDEEDVI